jgi:hypothetical protein
LSFFDGVGHDDTVQPGNIRDIWQMFDEKPAKTKKDVPLPPDLTKADYGPPAEGP